MSDQPANLVYCDDYPYATLQLYFVEGSLTDPHGKEGLLYLTSQMLMRGTASYTQQELAEEIEVLGGGLDVSVGREHVVIEGDTLSRNLERFGELLREALGRPSFPQEEIDKLRRQTIAEIDERRDNDEELARHLFYQVLFQPDVSARPVRGTPESLRRISREDIVRCYERVFVTANLLVGAAGHVAADDLSALLDSRLALPVGEARPDHTFDIRDPEHVRVVLVDKPGRTQSQVFFGHSTLDATDPDYYPLLVGSTIYGGTFTARLSQEIREKRGWSYGAYSYLQARRHTGSFVVRFYPATADTAQALELALEMQRQLIDDGVDDEEVAFAKSYLVNHFPFRLQTPRKRLDEMLRVRLLGLPEDTTERFVERIEAVTTVQINHALRRHLKSSALTVMVVCTASEVRAAIEAIDRVDEVEVHPFDLDWPHDFSRGAEVDSQPTG